MTLMHNSQVSQTIINLEAGDILYVQSMIHDKTFTFRVGQDKMRINNIYTAVKLVVEDNLFIVETTSNKKIERKIFSETWGFYIEKFN